MSISSAAPERVEDAVLDRGPRRHHFVPACHLAQFTDERARRGRLWCADVTWGSRRISTAGAERVRNDYYRDGARSNDEVAVERALGGIESRFASAVRSIDEIGRLPRRDDVAPLVDALAVMVTRNPKCLDPVGSCVTGAFHLGRWLFRVESTAETDALVRELSESMRAVLAIPLSLSLIPDFRARTWSLLVARPGSGEFVTSDSPVSVVRPRGLCWAGLGDAESEVTMALTPRLALVGRRGGRRRSRHVGSTTIAEMNGIAVRSAARVVYSRSRDFWWFNAAGEAHRAHEVGTERRDGSCVAVVRA